MAFDTSDHSMRKIEHYDINGATTFLTTNSSFIATVQVQIINIFTCRCFPNLFVIFNLNKLFVQLNHYIRCIYIRRFGLNVIPSISLENKSIVLNFKLHLISFQYDMFTIIH